MGKAVKASSLRNLREHLPVPWENPEVVWEHPDAPYSIAKCDTPWDYGTEGYFLAHCLGTKDYHEFSEAHMVYSLRDALGIPHATILCLREDHHSPYGACWDIGSVLPFMPEPGNPMRILQVRGRYDDVAMIPYHRMVRDWFVDQGGELSVQIDDFERVLARYQDTDTDYHFRYLINESKNAFTWAFWNARMRFIARLEGASL